MQAQVSRNTSTENWEMKKISTLRKEAYKCSSEPFVSVDTHKEKQRVLWTNENLHSVLIYRYMYLMVDPYYEWSLFRHYLANYHKVLHVSAASHVSAVLSKELCRSYITSVAAKEWLLFYCVLGLGFLHGVRSNFMEDVSETSMGLIFTGHK
jgi:hypothetical protein